MKSRETGTIVPSACKASSSPRTCNAASGCTRSTRPGCRSYRYRNMSRGNQHAHLGTHKSTVTATRSTPRVPPITRQGPCRELPLQGDDASGTHDLAFHARLIELASQAGNAAGPQMHVDRKRGRAVNARGPKAYEDRKHAPPRNANAPSPSKMVNACCVQTRNATVAISACKASSTSPGCNPGIPARSPLSACKASS